MQCRRPKSVACHATRVALDATLSEVGRGLDTAESTLSSGVQWRADWSGVSSGTEWEGRSIDFGMECGVRDGACGAPLLLKTTAIQISLDCDQKTARFGPSLREGRRCRPIKCLVTFLSAPPGRADAAWVSFDLPAAPMRAVALHFA